MDIQAPIKDDIKFIKENKNQTGYVVEFNKSVAIPSLSERGTPFITGTNTQIHIDGNNIVFNVAMVKYNLLPRGALEFLLPLAYMNFGAGVLQFKNRKHMTGMEVFHFRKSIFELEKTRDLVNKNINDGVLGKQKDKL